LIFYVSMTDKAAPPRRSDATKANILGAARARFAAGGYEGATIRSVAADAKVDPALVMRYFGSKEGLFAAAAEFDMRLPDLTRVPRESLGGVLVGHVLDRWEADDTFVALLRAAATNAAAAECLAAVLSEQVVPAVAAISRDPVEARARAGLIASQFLGLALCRHVLRLPAVVALTRAQIIRRIGANIQQILTGDVS
jgi:AcrR family transcriptional regulator